VLPAQNREVVQVLDQVDPAAAAEMITTRFDYTINPIALIVTAVVIIGYFVFLVRTSEKEYRQVISERFGDGK